MPQPDSYLGRHTQSCQFNGMKILLVATENRTSKHLGLSPASYAAAVVACTADAMVLDLAKVSLGVVSNE
jgi:hypothetical protein